MKSKLTEFVKEGIAFNQKQIKKLEKEIREMSLSKKNTKDKRTTNSIDTIIKHDKRLIAEFKTEIKNLKKRI